MARKKKRQDYECPSVPKWLISFGDLMTLLLTFFILLYFTSTISAEKYYQTLRVLIEAFGGRSMVLEKNKNLIENKIDLEFKDMHPKVKKKKRLLKELNKIVALLREAGIEAELEEYGNRYVLRVKSDKLFKPGSDIPTPKSIKYFQEMCKRLREGNYKLNIIGYTDNIPIRSKRFKNNWELSAYRAISVLKIFIQCGYDPMLLSAAGRGEYDPIAPNTTPEGRAKNRRVEFHIYVDGI